MTKHIISAKEAIDKIVNENAYIRVNDWYTGLPMYELRSDSGDKIAAMRYDSVHRVGVALSSYKSIINQYYSYKTIRYTRG